MYYIILHKINNEYLIYLQTAAMVPILNKTAKAGGLAPATAQPYYISIHYL